MIGKNERFTSYFASYDLPSIAGKAFPPPPAGVAGTGRPAGIGFNGGANHRFGADENDWLGAEAYVAPLR